MDDCLIGFRRVDNTPPKDINQTISGATLGTPLARAAWPPASELILVESKPRNRVPQM